MHSPITSSILFQHPHLFPTCLSVGQHCSHPVGPNKPSTGWPGHSVSAITDTLSCGFCRFCGQPVFRLRQRRIGGKSQQSTTCGGSNAVDAGSHTMHVGSHQRLSRNVEAERALYISTILSGSVGPGRQPRIQRQAYRCVGVFYCFKCENCFKDVHY